VQTLCTIVDDFPGACCLPSGGCVFTGLFDCKAQGGLYQGAFSSCDGADCEPVGNDSPTWSRAKAGYR
jgi:hypothetical protein